MARTSATSVAAIVPHWNRRDLLRTLLASLDAQTRPFDEIIVADNGSTDGSPEIAEAAGARVLRLGANLGFAAAVNRGVQAASTHWVAILNNDVTLEPGWLDALLTAASAGNVWFATGKILRAEAPGLIDGTFDEISRAACADRCGAGKPDGPLWNSPRTIRCAPMTAALFRRDLFNEIGGLDESFGSYLEDVDFGLRCALAGREGVYQPFAIAYHRGSATLGAWSREAVWRISRNQVLLAAKHFRGQPLWPILAGQLLWGLVAARHGRAGAFLSGKFAGLRDARRVRADNVKFPNKNALARVLDASEQTILSVARQSGLSSYWRAYFWLSRR
jgi:GT2 family glycosyltransferase